MFAGSILTDVCVPTWLAVAGAILAFVALGSLLCRAVSWWREREERRERERLSLPRWIELVAVVVGTGIAVAGILQRVVSGDGVDHFTVDLQLDPGENHIRVWAEKPGAEPALTGVAVVREKIGGQMPCDPNYNVEGPIAIVGEDHFDLDSNGDGTGCEP